MKVAIGSDHRGLQLKSQLVIELVSLGFLINDYGPRTQTTIDYPDIAERVAKSISNQEVDFGVLICGTGIGMCITANKFKNVRATLCYDEFIAKIAREKYDANCLCINSENNDCKKILNEWVKSKFKESKRNIACLSKIKELDSNVNLCSK